MNDQVNTNTKPQHKGAPHHKKPNAGQHNNHAKQQHNKAPAHKSNKPATEDDADTVMLTIKMPNDLIEQLKVMSEVRGAMGYRTILRNYAIEGLARDAEKYGLLSDERLIAALQRRGAPQEAVEYVTQVLKIITPPKVAQAAPQESSPQEVTVDNAHSASTEATESTGS